MVSFNGNTGVYLQHAHTRICSIPRKAGDAITTVDPALPLHPAERALALALDAFGDTLTEVGWLAWARQGTARRGRESLARIGRIRATRAASRLEVPVACRLGSRGD